MSFASFHPVVQQWFSAELGVPTAAQERGWESIRNGRHTLIAAPTGSGKTLAAFLSALDELFQDGLRGELCDEVRVLYVSPLKALSADIHKNLAQPRSGIHVRATDAGLSAPRITAAVRTGDTTQSERAAMVRTPPNLLVTTPESLYLLLTADRSRQMLRRVRTVIVDEIHAVIGTRRGAHLALSLERLEQLTGRPLQRIGLSATQKPIEDVARFLVGTRGGDCTIVNEGHQRPMDLGVEIPRSALDAVMSHEVWEEYYDRLQALIEAHRTTLVFVNTRRMAERLARHLSERLGDAAVTAHHGSLSKETRLDAENRLKTGKLRALVATASLELGIDVGHVDLVCQIGSPHRIVTLLQRVGRSGHTISGTPKGRLFPVSREDLVESAALLRSVLRGELDAIVQHDAPLDVLAQQIVAESACGDCVEDDLFAMVTRAWPYRDLTRAQFDSVVKMAAEGFSTRRGRRAALLHRDEVNGHVRGRRGARLLAQTSGGAIPEVADYRVVLEPGDTFIGTLNEDFAIESMAGDVFQLGNSSWRVLQVAGGTVRVADAQGALPNIPFWFGEAPARSDELSRAVSDLRADIDAHLDPAVEAGSVEAGFSRPGSVEAGFSRPGSVEAGFSRPGSVEAGFSRPDADERPAKAGLYLVDWLIAETGIPQAAAEQLAAYFAEGRRLLGVMPTQQTLVLERFFDESGGMQLVLHAPFGSRINKAWGLALRKRFCRQFNFELQAAATEDALLLSLGPQHSFPLADVFRYLHPETTRDVLVQAFLDAPVFQTRWRWNATISLAVPRSRGGRKLAPQIQRMLADDLMASVFPDAAACLENIRDCLEEAMDFDGLTSVLRRIHDGELRLVARDTPEPSVFAHEILNAKPYAFLDDAPLEERRAHAVQSRRAGEPSSSGDLGALDPAAIERVREEARAEPRDADELHDALMTAGFLTPAELRAIPREFVDVLLETRRATYAGSVLVAAERVPEISVISPGELCNPRVQPPPSRAGRVWTRAEAIVEMLRGRLTIEGPVTVDALAASFAISPADAEGAMLALEAEGVVLRGRFTPGADVTEWCDRALLSRIHRYTLNRLRAEIEPVSAADYMRFLFRWQHVEPSARLAGSGGLREIVAQLDGFEVAVGAWERSVLPARLDAYDPSMLDMLCLEGEIGWARLSAPGVTPGNLPRLVPATPIALFLREHGDAWRSAREEDAQRDMHLTESAKRVLDVLNTRGACFFAELRGATSFDADELRSAIGILVACGLAVSDGFSGLRALVWASRGRTASNDRRATFAGRWTATAASLTSNPVPARLTPNPVASGFSRKDARDHIDLIAWTLLRRYGVVFRRVLARETIAPPWRDLCRACRRLEARGEIRGGRFVSGMSSEQFALPEAVSMLREVRRSAPDGRLLTISTADPLNLAGIVTPGDRVRAAGRNRMAYRDGVPLAVMEGEFLRDLAPVDPALAGDIARALSRRKLPSFSRT